MENQEQSQTENHPIENISEIQPDHNIAYEVCKKINQKAKDLPTADTSNKLEYTFDAHDSEFDLECPVTTVCMPNKNGGYVVVYQNETANVVEFGKNLNGGVWRNEAGYNYGLPVFKRFYDDQNLRPIYFTGNGAQSTPYEIFDFKQLLELQTSIGTETNRGGYFVLAKDVFTTSETAGEDFGYHLNGNGHSIVVKSFKGRDTEAICGVFGNVRASASIYNINVIVPAASFSISQDTNFGVLGLSNNSQNIHDICVLIEDDNSITFTGTNNVYAGGLFAETNVAQTISRIYSNISFVANGPALYEGAFVGRVLANCSFAQCVATRTANFVGVAKQIVSSINITNSYTKVEIAAENKATFNFVKHKESSVS